LCIIIFIIIMGKLRRCIELARGFVDRWISSDGMGSVTSRHCVEILLQLVSNFQPFYGFCISSILSSATHILHSGSSRHRSQRTMYSFYVSFTVLAPQRTYVPPMGGFVRDFHTVPVCEDGIWR